MKGEKPLKKVKDYPVFKKFGGVDLREESRLRNICSDERIIGKEELKRQFGKEKVCKFVTI